MASGGLRPKLGQAAAGRDVDLAPGVLDLADEVADAEVLELDRLAALLEPPGIVLADELDLVAVSASSGRRPNRCRYCPLAPNLERREHESLVDAAAIERDHQAGEQKMPKMPIRATSAAGRS